MEIPLKYELTREMVNLISQIETKKTILDNIQIPNSLVTTLQRQSLLKSSLFSAKIEGNTLEIKDLRYSPKLNPDYKQRLEVENILLAFSFIAKNQHKEIDIDYILSLHAIVMKGLRDDLGRIRTEVSAIFNQSGFPVYIPPPPSELPDLLKKLTAYINEVTNENILIKGSLLHISFEKIHPFLDGNGRVGRLLFQAIIAKKGYGFNRLLSIEELLNDRKEEYYAYLDKNDATSFIEFMLEIINDQAQKILDEISSKKQTSDDLLLPRRKEILDVIRDHKVISLDSIRRRFLKVSSRMIRYDLKKLEEQGFIIKLGTTRGAMYKIK
jgi:Fic family protein